MSDFTPILLNDEGKDTQKHDKGKILDLIPPVFIDFELLISKQAGNTLKIGSDGKFWVRGNCVD